ncbi:thiamine phosphate synthase [Labrys monachus]|uniref:Thiamine-phosphate synthase n=1 Tax=Labrys monachus TaxID=217067 RepID=A0ABU0FNI5_9HYPH|nr:thiamine phosphate synthase [Labrys monachus]MDQ0395654.1 thiamine-phosphate pyrophosphorylase [Labrys monachus]
MILRLDPFYPVVDSAGWVARLVEAGTRLVQLRVKDRPPGDTLAEIRRALALCHAAGAQLVVNDHWQAAIEAGADFVHLGQGDLDTADLPAIRRAGLRLGVSTHDHAELERGLSADPDYVALGPIYPTTLKVMPFAPQGLGRIGEWKRLIGDRPLVAIGGITLERAPLCFEAGADCLALVSDVTGHADPASRIRAWIAATRGRSA